MIFLMQLMDLGSAVPCWEADELCSTNKLILAFRDEVLNFTFIIKRSLSKSNQKNLSMALYSRVKHLGGREE